MLVLAVSLGVFLLVAVTTWGMVASASEGASKNGSDPLF